jgi:hypothetical protein
VLVDPVCAKASGKDDGGGGGCQLIGTVLFEGLSLGKCQGFKYSTPKKGHRLREKTTCCACNHDHWRNELMKRGVLPPRTFVTARFERYQNNIQDVAGTSSYISSWAAGAVTATWREPTNRDWIDQISISVIFFASSDGRLRPHVNDVPSNKYIYMRSDVRIGKSCQNYNR